MRNIEDYLISLKQKLADGVATEHIYRFALQRLLEAGKNCDLKKVALAPLFIKKGELPQNRL